MPIDSSSIPDPRIRRLRQTAESAPPSRIEIEGTSSLDRIADALERIATALEPEVRVTTCPPEGRMTLDEHDWRRVVDARSNYVHSLPTHAYPGADQWTIEQCARNQHPNCLRRDSNRLRNGDDYDPQGQG